LQQYNLDVFAQTAKQAGKEEDKDYPFSIDGLLSIAEIEKIVKVGYRVLIEDPAEKRARGAGDTIDFPRWLQGMQTIVTQERAASAKVRGKSSKK
jgi:hypothetical protein